MTRAVAGACLLLVGALALQQCTAAPAEPQAPGAPAFIPVASVDQLMDAIIIPNADVIWNSAVWVNGVEQNTPKTDSEWLRVQESAIALAEAGNLLQIGGQNRVKDHGQWVKYSRDLTEVSVRAAKAAERKALEDLMTVGAEIYTVCTNCHRDYIPAE